MTRSSGLAVAIETSALADSASQAEASGNVRRLRLQSRRRVNVPAIAYSNGTYFHVEVRNISATGAGILLHRSIAVDDSIELHFPDGPKLEGRLRWRRMGFCGIELSKPVRNPLLPGTLPADHSQERHRQQPPNIERLPRAADPVQAVDSGIHALVSRSTVQLAAWLERLKRRRETRMIERACRKQGHVWLADVNHAEFEVQGCAIVDAGPNPDAVRSPLKFGGKGNVI